MKRFTDANVEAAIQGCFFQITETRCSYKNSTGENTTLEDVCDNIIKIIEARFEESPAIAENAILALVGFGISLPPSLYQRIELINDRLMRYEKKL